MSKILSINKMKNLRYKIMAISVALLMVLSIGAAFAPAKAALPSEITAPRYAFCSVSPDPCGVGQSLFIDMWTIEYDPLSSDTATPSTVWVDWTVVVTTPSGTTTTLGPTDASAAATADFIYTPTVAGNYSFFLSMPAQLVQSASAGINILYLECNATATCTVQTAPITAYPETPLPTSYWTQPVYWENQLWYSICGNWYGDINSWNSSWASQAETGYNALTTVPLTAHIMWTKPDGGIFGGQNGLTNANDLSNYYTGKSYEQFYTPPIIINGVLYYNQPMGVQPGYGAYAVDLRTGQQLFIIQNATEPLSAGDYSPAINYGEVFSWHNPNEVGSVAYLWGVYGTTYNLYDATTGRWILKITGATSGTTIQGPNGEILVYTIHEINSTYAWLSMWNSTLCLGYTGFTSASGNEWEYRPLFGGTSIVWSLGVQWNVTQPLYIRSGGSPNIIDINDGYILVTDTTTTGTVPENWDLESGYSAVTGAYLWGANRSLGEIQETTADQYIGGAYGIYVEHNKETGAYYGFSMATGTQIWGPVTPSTNPWDVGYARDASYTPTQVIIQGIATIMALNLQTGALEWTYTAPPAGEQEAAPTYLFEGLYANLIGGTAPDQEFFVSTCDSHGDQLFRGCKLYALNTTNGDIVWSIDFNGGQAHAGTSAISDGYYTAVNEYDNQIYTFGKGPSATTVEAPLSATTEGNSLEITGTVMDISAGSQQASVKYNYPNGLPCVSDASESSFMASVYEQQTMPNNITGVPVTLTAIDPNHNFITLGTTTTNAEGQYGYAWNTPMVPGQYEIIATFAGTGSNYGSTSTTYVDVSSAPAATTAPTATPTSVANMYFVPAIAGLFVLIIVVAIVLALLMLRKKP